jgi:hypothetical protein
MDEMPTESDLKGEGFILVTPNGFMVNRFNAFVTKLNSLLKSSFVFNI